MGADLVGSLKPFGLAGLAIAAIVIVVSRPRGVANWLIALALLLIAGLFVFEKAVSTIVPAAAVAAGAFPNAFWFVASGRVDWGGFYTAYTSGDLPRYKSAKGAAVCDTSHEGDLVTCWDNRLASGGLAPTATRGRATPSGVPTRIVRSRFQQRQSEERRRDEYSSAPDTSRISSTLGCG
jgi:hypothetical protein